MAYDTEKLTKLGALKQLAERIKTDFATKEEFEAKAVEFSDNLDDLGTKIDEVEGRLDDITEIGGEPNAIVEVKVNGQKVDIAEDRSVNISVPTDNAQLANGAGYQKASEVEALITAGINAWANNVGDETIDSFKEVIDYIAEHKDVAADLITDVAQAKLDIDALEALVGNKAVATQIAEAVAGLANAEQVTADIAKAVEGLAKEADLEKYVETTTLTETLTNYVKTTTLDGYVEKEGEKVLSTNDYTNSDKAKVDALVYATEAEIEDMLNEVFTTAL